MNDFFGIAFFADNPGEYYSIFLLFPAPQRLSESFSLRLAVARGSFPRRSASLKVSTLGD